MQVQPFEKSWNLHILPGDGLCLPAEGRAFHTLRCSANLAWYRTTGPLPIDLFCDINYVCKSWWFWKMLNISWRTSYHQGRWLQNVDFCTISKQKWSGKFIRKMEVNPKGGKSLISAWKRKKRTKQENEKPAIEALLGGGLVIPYP